jgi:hypothetical protein
MFKTAGNLLLWSFLTTVLFWFGWERFFAPQNDFQKYFGMEWPKNNTEQAEMLPRIVLRLEAIRNTGPWSDFESACGSAALALRADREENIEVREQLLSISCPIELPSIAWSLRPRIPAAFFIPYVPRF